MTKIDIGRIRKGIIRALRVSVRLPKRQKRHQSTHSQGLRQYMKSTRQRLSYAIMSVLMVVSIVLPFINIEPAQALQTPHVVDSDITTQWIPSTGTTHFELVNESTSNVNTADYISTGTAGSGGEIAEFGLSSPSAVEEATNITIYIYAYSATNANGGDLDTVDINLYINGAYQTATNVIPAYSATGTHTWYSASYSGSWNQTQLDAAQVYLRHNVVGGGGPSTRDDDVRVAAVYADITYTQTTTFDQSSYRWFENEDAADSATFAQSWGGTSADYGYSLVQTSDGGYAVTGSTLSYGAGSSDMFLAKYTSTGTLSWSKTWGGTGNDYGYSLVQTSDGGYAVTGYTASYGAGSDDMFLAKYASDGTLSWSKTWGGTGTDIGRSLVQTSDGGYAVTGYTASYGAGNWDMFLAKYASDGTIVGCNSTMCQSPTATTSSPTATEEVDGVDYTSSNSSLTATEEIDGVDYTSGVSSPSATVTPIVGHVTFAKTWGGTNLDYGRSIVQTSDGGYATTGYTQSYGAGGSDMFIAKYTSAGLLSWSRVWGGASTDRGHSLVEASDGGYVVTGWSSSFGTADMIIVKFTSTGALSWSNTLDVAGSDDYGESLAQTSDGGYIVTGYGYRTGSFGYDMFLAKYTSDGTLSWSRTWGGSSTGTDRGRSVVQTVDGGYAVTGDTGSYGAGGFDMFLAKYTSDGSLSWSKTWGGTGYDSGYSLVQTSDGGYAVTGETLSYGAGDYDMFLAKYASDGTLSWSKTWGGTGLDYGYSIIQASDGGYVVTGDTTSYGAGSNDAFLVKYDSSGILSWSKTWGDTLADYGNALVQTADGGYVVSGYTYSYGAGNNDMFLAKYTSDGSIVGCSSTMCQSYTVAPGSPTATVGNPSAVTTSLAATVASPTATTSSPSAGNTFQVNLAIWGEDVAIPGVPLAPQDTAASAERRDAALRLRMLMLSTNKSSDPAVVSTKLQVAPKIGTCDTSFTGESYVDLASSSAFDFYDNTNLADADWARPFYLDPIASTSGDVWYENYEESANFTNKHYIGLGDYGLWDIALTPNAEALGGTYCFRAVQSDGGLLADYDYVPELYIPPAQFQMMRHGQWFDASGTKQPFYW